MALVVGSVIFSGRVNQCLKPGTVSTAEVCNDIIPPTITSYTLAPTNNPNAASVQSALTVQFSEPVSNVTTKSFLLFNTSANGVQATPISASVVYNSTLLRATLTPLAPLNPGGAFYTAVLTADIADQCNNRLNPVSFTFETA